MINLVGLITLNGPAVCSTAFDPQHCYAYYLNIANTPTGLDPLKYILSMSFLIKLSALGQLVNKSPSPIGLIRCFYHLLFPVTTCTQWDILFGTKIDLL